MQLKQTFIIPFFILFYQITVGQLDTNRKINTSAAEEYFKIVDLFAANREPEIADWQLLFNTTVCQLMISGGALDTLRLKVEMKHALTAHGSDSSASNFTESELHHLAYKNNEEKLKNYIVLLKSLDVADSIKKLLYPYLPDRLKSDEVFPTLFYLNYGTSEATGDAGLVLNDLLLSYKIDQYKFGLLAAHESFHAVVSLAFQRALKTGTSYDKDYNLFYFMETVSQEGIADLIDKPILLKKESPVFEEVNGSANNDEQLSVLCIKRLDSVLKIASTSELVLNNYGDLKTVFETFGGNGGHIPGRFMAKIIAKAGLLQKLYLTIEDPVSFVRIYNEAIATGNRKKYPVFSRQSVEYLAKIKNKYFKK